MAAAITLVVERFKTPNKSKLNQYRSLIPFTFCEKLDFITTVALHMQWDEDTQPGNVGGVLARR